MTQNDINLAIKNGVADKVYPKLVQDLINEKYSIFDEFALINNHLIDGDNQEHLKEWNEYQAYRLECKAKAKELLKLDETIENENL